MEILLFAFVVIGINFTIWSVIGFLRLCSNKYREISVILALTSAIVIALATSIQLVQEFFPTLIQESSTMVIAALWALFSLIGGLLLQKNVPGDAIKIAPFLGVLSWGVIFAAQFAGHTQLDVDGLTFGYIVEQLPHLVIASASALVGSLLLVKESGTTETTMSQVARMSKDKVAAIIPAHNEERTIKRTLDSLAKVMDLKNVYVGSDASTDSTVEIVRSTGAQVIDIQPNMGKANVLSYLISYFDLIERYDAVMIVDADSEIDEDYLDNALPLFNDSSVAAIAVHALAKWREHLVPQWSMFFSAYRVRYYRLLQMFLRYGQTWKYTNVTTIVPGFASIYRTSALRHITINTPGLVIEDFNMTFQTQKKKLGKILYAPNVRARTLDPRSFGSYVKQVERWNLGFWQTVFHNGIWASAFWVSLAIYIAELIFLGIMFLFIPFIFLWLALNSFDPILMTLPFYSLEISIWGFIIGVLAIDYALTVLVAVYERNPMLLFYGLGFTFLRYVDTFILLYTLPLATRYKSDGRWSSPERILAEAV